MVVEPFDAICVVLSLLLFVGLIRGVRQGYFDSIHGEKLILRRSREPVAFWIQAAIILATAVVIAWGAII